MLRIFTPPNEQLFPVESKAVHDPNGLEQGKIFILKLIDTPEVFRTQFVQKLIEDCKNRIKTSGHSATVTANGFILFGNTHKIYHAEHLRPERNRRRKELGIELFDLVLKPSNYEKPSLTVAIKSEAMSSNRLRRQTWDLLTSVVQLTSTELEDNLPGQIEPDSSIISIEGSLMRRPIQLNGAITAILAEDSTRNIFT